MLLSRFLSATLLATALALVGCGPKPAPPSSDTPPETTEAAPTPAQCPTVLPANTRCLSGRDSAGAYYLIALPQEWNGHLVLHAHGGPSLGPPSPSRPEEDLKRWAIEVKAGYAWAGSSYRQGGVAVHAAAEDTERLRRIFVQHVAVPTLTILHGQSWGASVAAVGASLFTDDGHGGKPYDAVLLTSGVLAGGTRAYDFRLDLRVIYQYLCNNHPRPDEAPYPLWMGLPPGASLTEEQLSERVNECLGLDKPAAQRSPEQQQRVKTIVDVVHINERSIQSHLEWATWHFQDIVRNRTGGASPFGNIGARYVGSTDDEALNRDVPRYHADPQAVKTFGADTDPDGRIPVPVLTVHGIQDPTAFVEMENAFHVTMERAGTADHLVQTFTADNQHSYLTDSAYPTLLAALTNWARGGGKPTPADIADQCHGFEATFGHNCHFVPDYSPPPLDSRIVPRQRD